MCQGSRSQGGASVLVTVKTSPPPRSGAVHPLEQEIRKRRQETSMVEQGASSRAQVEEKGTWNVEEGQATWEEYRNIFRTCRDSMRKTKAHQELMMARDVKKNKKGFFSYINSKRKARDNVGPLLNEAGVLVMDDAEKAELLNAFFASVFSAKAGPKESQAPEVREEAYKEDDFPLVKEDCVRDGFRKLDDHKSMGPEGMHARVLRELADVIAEPLSIIFERSWRTEEVPEDWRKANVSPIFKKCKKEDPRNYRLVSIDSRKGDGAAYPGGHHQASGGKEGYQE